MDDLQTPFPPKATGLDAAKLKEVPKLTPGEVGLLYLTIGLLLAVGTIGLVASFQSVSEKAADWGFTTPELLPIAIDLAIPGFTIAHLLLIRMDMELAWVRVVPWALTAVTVYLNVQAGTSNAAKVGHGALPLVWVVCSEIASHVYRVLIGQATGKRMERVRRARAVLSPFRTGALWRRMILWEETSYAVALDREKARLLAHADLRERYGRAWRWKAPIRERVLLRLGEATPGAPQSATTERLDGASSPAVMAPRELTAGRPEGATNDLRMAPQRDAQGATNGATVDLTKRPEGATAPAIEAPSERPESPTRSATEAPPKRHGNGAEAATAAPLKRPDPRPRSAAKAPRPTPSGRPGSAPRDAARDAIKALYGEFGRRPLESEMVAVLKKAKLPHSRQFANARRREIETEHPGLAALGSENVRPLTGTDS